MKKSLSSHSKIYLSPSNPKQSTSSTKLKKVGITPKRSSLSPRKNVTSRVLRTGQQVFPKFRALREKLSQTLDTFTLLIRSKNPIRCLEHNSSISIYCETQQKLLCANCIFGRTEHKFHRVIPVDRSLEKIENDVETMGRLIDREIDSMRKTSQRLLQALVEEEKDTHDYLTLLVGRYEEAHKQLEDNFLISKRKIIDRLELVRLKYEALVMELKFQTENYSMGKQLRPANNQYFKREQIALYEHMISSAIVGQKKFQQGEWITIKKEVASAATEERNKIQAVLDLIYRLEPKARDK